MKRDSGTMEDFARLLEKSEMEIGIHEFENVPDTALTGQCVPIFRRG